MDKELKQFIEEGIKRYKEASRPDPKAHWSRKISFSRIWNN